VASFQLQRPAAHSWSLSHAAPWAAGAEQTLSLQLQSPLWHSRSRSHSAPTGPCASHRCSFQLHRPPGHWGSVVQREPPFDGLAAGAWALAGGAVAAALAPLALPRSRSGGADPELHPHSKNAPQATARSTAVPSSCDDIGRGLLLLVPSSIKKHSSPFRLKRPSFVTQCQRPVSATGPGDQSSGASTTAGSRFGPRAGSPEHWSLPSEPRETPPPRPPASLRKAGGA